MRTFSKWLLATLAAVLLTIVLASVLALGLAIEGAPRVSPRDDVTPDDVDRAVMLARLHDPRLAVPGQLRSLSMQQRDLDLLVYHAAHRWLGATTRVQLAPGSLRLQASVAAPWGRWANVELGLRQTVTWPEVDRLRVGRLPLPPALALPVLLALAERRGVQTDALLAVDWIERVSLASGQLAVTYRIGADTISRLRAALTAPGAQQQRLRIYAERLAALTQGIEGDETSVANLLRPLIALAAERSAAGGDAVAENRAALLTLTFFANHRSLGLIIPSAYGWAQPRPLNLTLQGRYDFPLHFLISAVIAAESDTPLADAVGVWKELADARRGGSGFSFNDLAADRAGTRLGEMATRDPARLQARLAPATGGTTGTSGASGTSGTTDKSEADFMPDASDLPEFLPEAEFVARYGGVGGAAYRRMLADIEARLDALPLFR